MKLVTGKVGKYRVAINAGDDIVEQIHTCYIKRVIHPYMEVYDYVIRKTIVIHIDQFISSVNQPIQNEKEE